MEEKNIEKTESKAKDKIVIEVKKRSIIKSFLGTVIIIAVVCVLYNNFFVEKKTTKTVVSSMLTDQKIVNQLSTLVIPYGGVYEETNSEEKIKYIAYSGTITYGIDFSKLDVSYNEDEKIITVHIPDINLTKVFVEPKSLSSIPEGSIDDLRTRLSKCENDLREKFNNKDDEMIKFAHESARETLLNFLNPIVDSVGDGYKIQVE
jgi:predicted nucleic-acid-binding protein